MPADYDSLDELIAYAASPEANEERSASVSPLSRYTIAIDPRRRRIRVWVDANSDECAMSYVGIPLEQAAMGLIRRCRRQRAAVGRQDAQMIEQANESPAKESARRVLALATKNLDQARERAAATRRAAQRGDPVTTTGHQRALNLVEAAQARRDQAVRAASRVGLRAGEIRELTGLNLSLIYVINHR